MPEVPEDDDAASQVSPLGVVGDALQRLRCNAWRFNSKTKTYDRVDEDVAIVEAELKRLERHLEVMNEASSNYELMAKHICNGWEKADQRTLLAEVLLRRSETLRAMLEAELEDIRRTK